jgi:uncharacterized protein
MKEIDIKEISEAIRPYPFIVAAYQFGSTIRGDEGPLSDLDIAILVRDEQIPLALDLLRVELLLAYELQRQLHVQEVDLVTLNRQRLPLQYAILRTGRLIYETNSAFRIRFVQKVVQDYLDFRPTLEMMSQFHTLGRLRRCGIR